MNMAIKAVIIWDNLAKARRGILRFFCQLVACCLSWFPWLNCRRKKCASIGKHIDVEANISNSNAGGEAVNQREGRYVNNDDLFSYVNPTDDVIPSKDDLLRFVEHFPSPKSKRISVRTFQLHNGETRAEAGGGGGGSSGEQGGDYSSGGQRGAGRGEASSRVGASERARRISSWWCFRS